MANSTAEKMIQESFDTTEKDRSENWKLRQERFQTGDLKYVLKLEGKELEVINYSSFGIAVYSKTQFTEKQTFSDVPFLMESTEISKLEVKVVRVEAMADKGFKVGFEVVGQPLNLSRINGVTGAIELQNISNARLRHKDQVSPKIRSIVYEVKNEMEVIEDDLAGVQESTVFINNQERDVYEEAMIEGMARHMSFLIQNALDAMEDATKGLSKDEIKHGYDFFRMNLRHLIFQSPFSSRSNEKPLGYAGDFEMMRMLYRDENLGNCLFGKALHRCFDEYLERTGGP